MSARYPVIALAAALLAAPLPALAHAHLVDADPPVGGTVKGPPAAIAINFSEGLEPRFSTIVVTDAKGARVDKADLHTAPGNAKHVEESLQPLAAGTYQVTWHATSVDTHKTQGTFTFTVAP